MRDTPLDKIKYAVFKAIYNDITESDYSRSYFEEHAKVQAKMLEIDRGDLYSFLRGVVYNAIDDVANNIDINVQDTD